MNLLTTDLLSQFSDSIHGNPYIDVARINPHRMQFNFLDLTGLAMLCRASEAANVFGNICLSSSNWRSATVTSFRSIVSNFTAEQQAVYLISICWGLRDLGWNVNAINRCENLLQAAFLAPSLEPSEQA